MFGTATAAYQVEGAWNADGKSESIWDHLTHNRPGAMTDNSNGDIADNSYYLYKRDVQMMRELGLDFYRFSVSWTRILPTSFPDKTNQAGVDYYNNLIDELLKYNIQPMLTLYHWDLPQKLQDLGGWTNPEIVTWFGDYARTIFTLFGDRVKNFITINEPYQICVAGYGTDWLAPQLAGKGIAEYMCAKNVLLAHAKAYHIYEEFRSTQKGNISISLSAQWYEPATDSAADVEAAHEANQFNWAQYSWPIFSDTGDFPPEMRKRIAAKSEEQGFPRSRLPEFTPEEVELLKGSSDYFALNHYSTHLIHRIASKSEEQGFPRSRLPEFTPKEVELLKGSSDYFALNHYSTHLIHRIASKSAEQGFPRSRLPEFTPKEVELLKGSSDYFALNHYSTHLIHRIAAKSEEQGFPRSRLPEFTPEEVELLKGSSDYFALNHYSTHLIHRNASVPVQDVPSYSDDLGVGSYQLSEWQLGESRHSMYVPWGFRKLLNRIKNDYGNPPVVISENGAGSHGGIVDDDRVQYYRGYLDAVLDALDDGCDVIAYTAWSLMDNFEWTSGYTERYGLYEVDYDSIYRTRSPRKSAYVYKELLRTRTLDHHYEPDLSVPITIDAGH
ncbi:myrosinase 1-like [Maniola jurtina]|uniref:myrosinase 1-like n=1 Tax=Maniola jurtina TaxID=191418 RepID=UPI001E6892B1|nr:myrosinase 1-like [Maniola jurtina]